MNKFFKNLSTIFLSIFFLFSCSNRSSASDSSSEISNSGEYKIEVFSLPQLSYDRFDTFSASDMQVNVVKYTDGIKTMSVRLNSVSLYINELNEYITSSYVFKEIGDFTVTVSDNLSAQEKIRLFDNQEKNIQSTSFTIHVDDVTDYTSSFTVDMSKVLDEYELYTSFNYQDISGTYYYSYTNKNQKRLDKKLNLTYQDLNIYIDSKNAKGFVFEKPSANYKLEIEYIDFYSTHLKKEKNITVTGSTVYDTKKMTVHFTNENKETSADKGYYTPDEIKTNSITTFNDMNCYNQRFTPSTGNVNMLIIPLILPGDTVTKEEEEKYRKDIVKAFSQDDCSFYSLKDYYYKSSYGKLNLDFTFSPTCDVVTDLEFSSGYHLYKEINKLDPSSSNLHYAITNIVYDATEWAINKMSKRGSEFDSNKDGAIDGVWFMYMGHEKDSNNTLYWAFSSSTSRLGTDVAPAVNTYGWCGTSFLYDDPMQNVDTHVLIHETGHMLGLSDYYSYSYSGYSPLGKIDMMDNNVGDHNPFSKILLGWSKPYVVYGNDVTLSINTSSLKNDSIILFAYDDKTYKKDTDGKVIFNIYDEYMLLDYYYPIKLNSSVLYTTYNVKTVSLEGGRLYHVDNRLAKKENSVYSMLGDPDDILSLDSSVKIEKVINNSEAGSRSESNAYSLPALMDHFDELRWISADGRFHSEVPSYTLFGKINNIANENSIFTTEKNRNTFSLSLHKNQFVNGTLNIQKECSYSFTIESIE